MGKKYDEYVDAVNMNNAAKSNVHSAYGGSTASHMDDVLDTAAKAQQAEDDARKRVLEDPEG